MGKLVSLDRAIIERVVEPVAHKVEHVTGATNFVQARGVLVLYPAVFISIALNTQAPFDLFMVVIVVIAATMCGSLLWAGMSRATIGALGSPTLTRSSRLRYSCGICSYLASS